MTIRLLALLCVLLPAAGLAEGLLDVYAGYHVTQDDDNADVKTSRPLITDDAEFDGSPIGGVRIGGWFEGARYLGGALDVSYFELDGDGSWDDVTIEALPVSALLMLRLPLLEDDTFKNGRVQPYVAAGPSVLWSQFKLKPPGLGSLRDASVDIGADGRLGGLFRFTPDVGVFLEYRFTYFEPRYDDIHKGVSAEVSPRLMAHSAQLGLSFRY